MSLKPRSRGIASAIWRRGLQQDVGQPLGLLHRRLDLVEAEVVGDLLDEVDDVVERRGEREDVLAVDRRDERLVEALDDVVRDPVALLLADEDVAREVRAVGIVREHLVEQVGARARCSPPASSKRSKNSRSLGAKTWDSRAMRGRA